MRWLDGSEMDFRQLLGEELCEKLALEMYDYDREQWFECDEFIRNALLIIDFDTEITMEGFATPYNGNFSNDYYCRIVDAFRAIGDDGDADILSEALRVDSHYTKLLEGAGDGYDTIYDEFCDKLDELEKGLYLNADFDMWAMLYEYLEKHIR